MLRLDLVAVNSLFTLLKNSVAGMEIEPVLSGHEGEYLLDVGHQLLGISGSAGIISGCLDTSGKGAVLVEAHNVVSLPAVH